MRLRRCYERSSVTPPRVSASREPQGRLEVDVRTTDRATCHIRTEVHRGGELLDPSETDLPRGGSDGSEREF